MNQLSAAAIETIVDYAGRRPSTGTDITIWHHGGAMSRVEEGATAYGGRSASFLVTGRCPGPTRRRARRRSRGDASSGARSASTRPAASTSNFAGLGEEKDDLVRAGYGANYERLAQLKTKYDPENLFRMNLNIAPAS